MYCQRCGQRQSVINARYCENCAQPLATTVYQVAQPTPPSKKYPAWIYAVAGFAAICLFCCGGLFINKSDKQKNITISEARLPDALLPTPEVSPTYKPKIYGPDDKIPGMVSPTPTPKPTPTPTPTAAERAEAEAGPKPEVAADGRIVVADLYFRLALKDYSSAEYLLWTPLTLAKHKKQSCWQASVRLRAKNSFGAYVVNDHTFWFRNGTVMDVK